MIHCRFKEVFFTSECAITRFHCKIQCMRGASWHLQKNKGSVNVLVADTGNDEANFHLIIDDDAQVFFGADLIFENGRSCQDFGRRTNHEIDGRPLLHWIR